MLTLIEELNVHAKVIGERLNSVSSQVFVKMGQGSKLTNIASVSINSPILHSYQRSANCNFEIEKSGTPFKGGRGFDSRDAQGLYNIYTSSSSCLSCQNIQ